MDIPTLQRAYWVKWWNNFSKKDIDVLYDQINEKVDSHLSKYQTTHKEISSFLVSSSLNHFEMLKAHIKLDCLGIFEQELMKKCMNFLKDQFNNSFSRKDDSSMNSNKDSEEGNSVIARE